MRSTRSRTDASVPSASARVTWQPVGLTLQTLATFSVICVLWSFWTSDSIGEWLVAVERACAATSRSRPVLRSFSSSRSSSSGARCARTRAGAKRPRMRRERRARRATAGAPFRCARSPSSVWHSCWRSGSSRSIPSSVRTSRSTIQSLRSGRLSRLDNAKLERGYYENLLQVDRFNSQLWEVYTNRPANWLDIQGGGLKQYTRDFAQEELKPSFGAATNFGTMSTNRWGMRDQDYERKPPPGVFRMALLGPSNVMGWGVTDGATFEALLENRLNEGVAGMPHVEVRNTQFRRPGPSAAAAAGRDGEGDGFAPRALLYVATGRELSRAARTCSKWSTRRSIFPIRRFAN